MGYYFTTEVLIVSLNRKIECMKKIFFCLVIATSFIACDNAADTGRSAQDSLDSIANAKKDMIDSSAEQRKEVIDSTTENQKDAMDRMDSMNRRKDSVVQ